MQYSSEHVSDGTAVLLQVEALLTAAKENDLDAFKAAAVHFSGDSLAEVRDGNGRTSLHFAAQAENGLAMVRYLLREAHMPANLLDETGAVPQLPPSLFAAAVGQSQPHVPSLPCRP